MPQGGPRQANHLILSQQGTLDRFGWQNWEIRRGALYCNELHDRYYWEPVHLLLPLYGVTDPALPHSGRADNVSSLVEKWNRREVEKSLDHQTEPPSATISECA
jgi:hypothetical protein